MPSAQGERAIDEALIASFPASDPPSWTLGTDQRQLERSGARAVARAEATWTFGDDTSATNPEELLGAAHAGCFSMFLAAQLTAAGFAPKRVHTTATVHLEAGPTIAKIELATDAEVPGIDAAAFQEKVEASKRGCPVSKALAAVPTVTVTARLV